MSVTTISRRGVALIVALLLAAFATAAWVSYVRSIERRAVQGNQAVEVYVAAEVIPAGTTAEAADERQLFVKEPVPQRLVLEGAVTSLADLRGTVAAVTILKGEQIVTGRFVSPAEAARVLQIPAGLQAMTVEVAAPPGVGGFIQPHDRVSVLANIDLQNSESVTRFVLQNVEVLAVGSRTSVAPPASGSREATRETEEPQPTDRLLLTLAVSPFQAEQLGHALLEGQIYFTLLPPGQQPQGTPGRTDQNLFG